MKKILFTMSVIYDENVIDSNSILQSIEHDLFVTRGVLISESDVIFDKVLKEELNETKNYT